MLVRMLFTETKKKKRRHFIYGKNKNFIYDDEVKHNIDINKTLALT